ncbi:MAG: hypothetical protein L7F77_02885, partial [Candidatus Magnetominusculus sp. LBB02]|nr:hypothetical protein [Candidatus Magnetominusculus sp. LBB02]
RQDGSNDHWGLDTDCREYRALRQLLKKKKDAAIIVEVIEQEQIKSTLRLIDTLMREEGCS